MARAIILDHNGVARQSLNSVIRFCDVALKPGEFLSWESNFYGVFDLSSARSSALLYYNGARIRISSTPSQSDGSRTATVRIESPSGEALEGAIEAATEYLGGTVMTIDPPLADSFVRGVGNDLRAFEHWLIKALDAGMMKLVGFVHRH